MPRPFSRLRRAAIAAVTFAGVLLTTAPVAADNLHAPVGIDCEMLIVDPHRIELPSCWLLYCGDVEEPRFLGCGLSELMEVDSLVASHDGLLLAVLSVGEGHPMLQVIDLERLLASGRVFNLKVFNPYPGGIDVVGWDAQGLLVTSDMPLTRADREGRVSEYLPADSARQYRLRSADWRFEEAPGAEPWTLPNGRVLDDPVAPVEQPKKP